MEQLDIEKAIKAKLDEFGFELNDLTPEEISALREEVEAEQRGEILIDGVLSNIPPYRLSKDRQESDNQ